MFQKLKVQLPEYSLEYGESKISYGDGDPTVQIHFFVGEKIIMNLIPERYRKNFNVNIMSVTTNLPPHTDNNILTTINHYFETNNAETIYYKVLNDNLKYRVGPNQTNGYIYIEQGLEKIGSFVAKPNEIWVLDVTVPHAVTTIGKSSGSRIVVTMQTSVYNYEQVIEMLKETNSL